MYISPPFILTVTDHPDHVEFTVRGDIDLATAHLVRRPVERELRAGASRVVINTAKVTFVDAHGLSALVGAWRVAREYHATITLSDPGRRVVAVLKLASLTQMFGISITGRGAVSRC